MKKHIAIVGGRDFNDFRNLEDMIGLFLSTNSPYDEIVIVSGGARGADSLAEEFADKYGFEKIIYKADWNSYGKQAGFVRNHHIINKADVVFAFWDGVSKGTKHSIDLAEKAKKDLFVIKY